MPPDVIIVMGVSGCGKSTVAALLAERLGWPLHEGDAHHPPANIAKMQAGIPLEDEDRWPWLQQLSDIIQQHLTASQPAVMACSALTPAYRHLLCTGRRCSSGHASGRGLELPHVNKDWDDPVAFVLLDPPRELLEQRLQTRQAAGAHFMPAALLDSQLAALQYEAGQLYMHVCGTPFPQPHQIVEAVVQRLKR